MHRQGNQHRIVPDEILRPHLNYAWNLGLNDKDAVRYILDKIKNTGYTLSLRTYRRRRTEWGLNSATKTGQTLSDERLTEIIQQIISRYKYIGYRALKDHIRVEMNLRVSRDRIRDWFHSNAPDLVKERKLHRFKRKAFIAAGVNHIWAVDQHDKWKRFGLWLHLGTEVFSGKLLWLKIWWTNKNPRLICNYYLDIVRELQAIPLLTQSDPGSENYGIANAQTSMRQQLDPTLEGTAQHRFKHKHTNVKPEIEWSQLRRHWSPGFENVLDSGLNQELYNPADNLQQLLWRWLAIPWLQAELDLYRNRRNQSARRKDPHKVLPNGIPDLIFHEPHNYNQSFDFRVVVSTDLIDEVASLWAPPEHEVFELVPPTFATHAYQMFREQNYEPVGINNFWQIFVAMAERFDNFRIQLNLETPFNQRTTRVDLDETIPLFPGSLSFNEGELDLSTTYHGRTVAPQAVIFDANVSESESNPESELSDVESNAESGSRLTWSEPGSSKQGRLMVDFTDDEAEEP